MNKTRLSIINDYEPEWHPAGKMQRGFLSIDVVVRLRMHGCIKSNDKYRSHISVLFQCIIPFTTHVSIA